MRKFQLRWAIGVRYTTIQNNQPASETANKGRGRGERIRELQWTNRSVTAEKNAPKMSIETFVWLIVVFLFRIYPQIGHCYSKNFVRPRRFFACGFVPKKNMFRFKIRRKHGNATLLHHVEMCGICPDCSNLRVVPEILGGKGRPARASALFRKLSHALSR